jgi:hypothetical protein
MDRIAHPFGSALTSHVRTSIALPAAFVLVGRGRSYDFSQILLELLFAQISLRFQHGQHAMRSSWLVDGSL